MRRLTGRFALGGAAILALGGLLAGCGQVSGLETQARILAEPPCTDFFFPVYFGSRSSDVSPAAQRVVRNAARQAQGCRGPRVEVSGLPNPQAAGDGASDLARQRARHLAEVLRTAGLPEATFQANPLGPTAAPRPGPERRRADVFIRFER